jgi:hypothetical protein
MIGRPPPPAAPKSGPASNRPYHSKVAGQDTACRVVERALTTLRRRQTQDKCQSSRNRGALEAAGRGVAVTRLALYEPPFIIDDSRPPVGDDFLARLQALIAEGRRSAAIKLFMTEAVRTPAIATVIGPLIVPVWAKFKALAHTLPYDCAIVDDYHKGKPIPAGRWPALASPPLVMAGGRSPAWMRHAMQTLAGALPAARYQVLDGQTHQVRPKALAPVLLQFFSQGSSGAAPAAGA